MERELVKVSEVRLWDSIERSAVIGKMGSGLNRLALSDADKQMRDLFVAWCQEERLTVAVDAMGNTFARRDGFNNELPAVFFGSHLDSQEEGGRFDGVLGVLAGLEVIRVLNDHDIQTKRPLTLVNWTNEEGARFPPPMVGSGSFTQVYETSWAHRIVATDDGRMLGDELERIGYFGSATIDQATIDSYLELHIEQGSRLEAAGKQIGVVTNAATVHGFRVAFTGETAHAGTRPMHLRKNALVAAARFAAAIDDIGWRFAASGGMATTTRIGASPNKPGILSNFCEVVGDIRHPDSNQAEAMKLQVEQALADASERSQCDYRIDDQWNWGGAIFDSHIVDMVRDATGRLGYAAMNITSQAGHDAYFMARICPTAMIFVPCVDGITHHPAELISKADAAAGANVLLHAVIACANRR